jgi:hypothetical protein
MSADDGVGAEGHQPSQQEEKPVLGRLDGEERRQTDAEDGRHGVDPVYPGDDAGQSCRGARREFLHER